MDALKDSEMKEPPNKKFRRNEEVDIRFLISSKEAGAIIGKAGANINHLRKTYKSSVTVPDCPGPERVLSIITSLDKLNKILTDIMDYIDDRPQKGSEKEVELRLLIHNSHAGGIIGKGGQRIRELREKTKAAIKVFSQCCPLSTERVCAIHGTPPVVIDAISTILDIILSTKVKGVINLYDPYRFDVCNASEYGGFTEPGPPGAYRNASRGTTALVPNRRESMLRDPWENDPIHGSYHPLSSSNQSKPWSLLGQMSFDAPLGTERRSHLSSSHSYQRWMTSGSSALSGYDPYLSDGIGLNEKSSANYHLGGGLPNLSHPMNVWSSNPYSNRQMADSDDFFMETIDGISQTSLSVPNSVAGAIIGKGGNRIRIIRRESGADISIENASDSSKERIITIKGRPQQVRLAYRMLQQT